MKQVKFGVVGCGGFAHMHISGLKTQKKAVINAICDLSEEAMKKVSEKFELDAECYTDCDEMLKKADIDAVIVATNDQAHREVTVKALLAGKHVLCEKPMALTVEDCEAMVEAQKKSGKQLMIGQICRMTPGFVEAKRLLDEGVIGELFYVESEYAHDYSTFTDKTTWRADPLRHIVIGGACHAIDLLRWIAGNPSETTAYSNKKLLTDLPTDDCVIAIFRFPNDVIGKVFTSSGCKRPYTMRTQLFGTKGTILVNNTDAFITVYRNHIVEGSEILDGVLDRQNDNEIEIKYPLALDNHNVTGEHTAFINAILDGTDVATNGYEGMATVKVCRAVIEAADTRKTVKIEY